MENLRIGIGYDSHRFVSDKPLILGGINIPYPFGLKAHSDGDVLIHAIIDAILGAAGLGNIGQYFPDTDQKWKNAFSIDLLRSTVDLINSQRCKILSIDSVIITEKPKILPHIDNMKQAIEKTGINSSLINIKAKTNEGMGFVGRQEGIAAMATCLLIKPSG
ncbi:2-C-methyl-D-erythritol 2,4-cyclodiphosphate synthase [Candidatus Magnetoovum chiemensis]|nr:2-C-methyl-D-erythritol 2,4-cyclodiphosphate synthase [Candidatus Magnetoovum chiemensis]